jgi:hypothetical protein
MRGRGGRPALATAVGSGRDKAHLATARNATSGRTDRLGGYGHLSAQKETSIGGDARADEAYGGQKSEHSGNHRLPKGSNLVARKSSQFSRATRKSGYLPHPMLPVVSGQHWS